MAEFWTQTERDALDTVTVVATANGIKLTAVSPGLAVITGSDGRPLDWQMMSGPGLSGSKQNFRGLGLLEFNLELTMHTAEHRAAYDGDWKRIMQPSPVGQPQKRIGISHPVLLDKGVTTIILLNDPLLEPDGAVGYTKIKYKAREYREPLPALSASTAPANTAVAEYERALQGVRAAQDEALRAALDFRFGARPPPDPNAPIQPISGPLSSFLNGT
jgi:hypothetical protein